MFVDVLGIEHLLEDIFRLNTIKFHILYSSKITWCTCEWWIKNRKVVTWSYWWISSWVLKMIMPHSVVTIIQSGNPHAGPTANRDMIVILQLKSWQTWKYQLLLDTAKLVHSSTKGADYLCVRAAFLCYKAGRRFTKSFTVTYFTSF